MPNKLWRALKERKDKKYDYQRLIDYQAWKLNPSNPSPVQIICDIDKTYLETEFESLLKMAKIAYESAHKKITVKGASVILNLARWAGAEPNALHFVSSSPPQLRATLEQKLALDGLDWTSVTFKNQAYNFLKGRMDLLKQHLAYKSAAILRIVQSAPKDAKFYLIGDNAESDAYIFLGVGLLLAGILDQKSYAQYLVHGGVQADIADDVAGHFPTFSGQSVEGIFIRNAPGYHFIGHDLLSSNIRLFDNFFQVGLMLILAGVIPATSLEALVKTFHNRLGFSSRKVADYLMTFSQAEDLPSGFLKTEAERLIAEMCAFQNYEPTIDKHFVLRRCDWQALKAKGYGADILKFSDAWIRELERHRKQQKDAH